MKRTLQLTLAALSGAAILGLSAASLHAGHFTQLSPLHTVHGVSQFNYTHLSRETGGRNHAVTLMNPTHVTQVAAVLVYQYPYPNSNYTACFRDPGGPGVGECDEEFVELDYEPEVFLGCQVALITPHAAVGLCDRRRDSPGDDGFCPAPGFPGSIDINAIDRVGVNRYAEVIWAPLAPVRVLVNGQRKARKLADGLGGVTFGTRRRDDAGFSDRLAHPLMFSLPEPKTVPAVVGHAAGEVFVDQTQAAIDCVCDGVFALGTVPFLVFSSFGITCP